jgi:hypothetical protein
MRANAWVAIVLISAGLGDGVAVAARAWCGPARATMSQGSCCCGPQACSTSAPAGPGVRSSCCDMRRLPVRDAETSSTAREGAPGPVTALLPMAAFVSATPAASVQDGSPTWRLPDSLHAPPLYDLFRSYRI